MKTRKLKTAGPIIAACLLLIAVLVLGWLYVRERAERTFLQANIDGVFSSRLSELYADLLHTDPAQMDEDQRLALKSDADICLALFPSTSYAGSTDFYHIVRSLADMAPPDPGGPPEVPAELDEDIGYLLLHLSYADFEELAEDVWASLSARLQEE